MATTIDTRDELARHREGLRLQVLRGLWAVPEEKVTRLVARILCAESLAEVDEIRREMLAAGW
jgi:hypothetical protein